MRVEGVAVGETVGTKFEAWRDKPLVCSCRLRPQLKLCQDRFQIVSREGLAQHGVNILHFGGGQTMSVGCYHNDPLLRPPGLDVARELRASHPNHGIISYNKIELALFHAG